MDKKDKQYLEDVMYFQKEKGDARRYVDYDVNKIKELNPKLCSLLIQYQVAEELLNEYINSF